MNFIFSFLKYFWQIWAEKSVWEKKLISLPEFLGSKKPVETLSLADLESGFKLTEYFIRKNLQPVKRFQIDQFFRSRNRVLSLNLH